MTNLYDLELLPELIASVTGFFRIPSTLLSLVGYVLTALALYTVAQRRGLKRPWLAWIPVVNCWILGSLSDQYRYVVKGENRSKRKWLLGLSIVMTMIGSLVAVLGIFVAGNLIGSVVYGAPDPMPQIMGPLLALAGVSLPLVGAAIAFAVLNFMALYDVYRSMDPSNSVLFLVLSILVPVTEPFFLFFNRNKDDGMPPRRRPRPPVVEQATWENQDDL